MRNKIAIIAAVVIIVAVAVVVGVMMTSDSKAAAIKIKDDALVISCSFGVTVPLDDISDLTFTEELPKIATKTNGASIGRMHKGEYEFADGSQARLYLNDEVPAYVRFTQGDTVFYLNADTIEDTKEIYDELQKAIG